MIALRVPLAVATLLMSSCAVPVRIPEIAILDTPRPASPPPASFGAARRQRERQPAPNVLQIPEPLPLPGQLKPGPLVPEGKPDRPPSAAVADAAAAARIEPARDGFINAIQVYPYAKGALYQVYAAVNQVTAIALEPGEKLISVSAGDTVRWIVGDTTSGEGAGAITHVLVKPALTGVQTNLLIATDRRTYHLELTALSGAYMASVAWTYPDSALIALKADRARAEGETASLVETGLAIERLQFRYRLEGDAPWKPVRVFDDGAKVYIQFPSGLAESEAPPLFVAGPDGRPALVNYRVRGTTYIVDRLFAAAELRLGVAPQRVVRILRTDAVWRGAHETATPAPGMPWRLDFGPEFQR